MGLCEPDNDGNWLVSDMSIVFTILRSKLVQLSYAEVPDVDFLSYSIAEDILDIRNVTFVLLTSGLKSSYLLRNIRRTSYAVS